MMIKKFTLFQLNGMYFFFARAMISLEKTLYFGTVISTKLKELELNLQTKHAGSKKTK